jgi:hypothetical protein
VSFTGRLLPGAGLVSGRAGVVGLVPGFVGAGRVSFTGLLGCVGLVPGAGFVFGFGRASGFGLVPGFVGAGRVSFTGLFGCVGLVPGAVFVFGLGRVSGAGCAVFTGLAPLAGTARWKSAAEVAGRWSAA